jgi:hypothetical protein
MSVIALITSITGLALKIFTEVFDYRARKRKEDASFELDKKKFLELADNVIADERGMARRESSQARTGEDQIDRQIGRD